jgi:hypothetical protein
LVPHVAQELLLLFPLRPLLSLSITPVPFVLILFVTFCLQVAFPLFLQVTITLVLLISHPFVELVLPVSLPSFLLFALRLPVLSLSASAFIIVVTHIW